MKLAIIERDGIVGQPVEGQLTGHHDWHTLPDAASSIARLNLSGWHVVLVANQPGLGRGLYDCAALNDYHRQMYKDLALMGAKVDAVFFCPHPPEDHCECWIPQAALLRQVIERYNMEAAKVAVVARSADLLQAATSLGTRAHWVQPAELATAAPSALQPNALCADAAQRHTTLTHCAETLLHTPAAKPAATLA